ncbi:MAG: hypothetical protein JO340_10705 [Acidobacteriaceae bacterium]|nr:hypothetical protein [Acidobacteriaceae bacterium]
MIGQMRKTVVLVAGVLLVFTACARKTVTPAPAAFPLDNSYMDLAPGGRLRITVPILDSGQYQVATHAAQQNGNTLTLLASELVGYEVSFYSIEKRGGGKVLLRFKSAEITENGATVNETSAPALPFSLPHSAQHIRLIYLVRVSSADHNMAIAASKDLDALNELTRLLKADPVACKYNDRVFCSWVPAGVAVRPE